MFDFWPCLALVIVYSCFCQAMSFFPRWVWFWLLLFALLALNTDLVVDSFCICVRTLTVIIPCPGWNSLCVTAALHGHSLSGGNGCFAEKINVYVYITEYIIAWHPCSWWITCLWEGTRPWCWRGWACQWACPLPCTETDHISFGRI